MKAIVIGVIVGIAGLMAWAWTRGECPGGTVVTGEAECQGPAGFDITFCRLVFERALDVARASNTVFTDENQCRQQYGACLPHATINGFVPRPHGFCVAGGGNQITMMVPVYRAAAGQR